MWHVVKQQSRDDDKLDINNRAQLILGTVVSMQKIPHGKARVYICLYQDYLLSMNHRKKFYFSLESWMKITTSNLIERTKMDNKHIKKQNTTCTVTEHSGQLELQALHDRLKTRRSTL